MLLEEKQKNVYKRLISYAGPYKKLIALAMVASLGVGGSDALIAWMVKPLVDDLLIAGDVELAQKIPYLVVALAAFKGLARYIQQYNIRTAGQAAVQDIRNQLYGHCIKMSMRFLRQ